MKNSNALAPFRRKRSVTRRELIRTGAFGFAGLNLARSAFAQTYEGGAFGANAPAAPPDDELSGSPFRLASGSSPYNLIDRITYSATPFETALMDKLGWNGYLEYHLKPAAIDESALESALTEFATLDVTPFENIRYLSYNQGFDIYYEMGSARILRATFARRQLLEVMTEFWLDHFNVFSNKIWHEFLPTYERTIRKYALSDFKTLLTQVVKSGAMLFYLDNTQNEIGRHNENFARELLELHSLGVDNGYWEADIYTARRCFTGWNFEGYYEWPWQNTTNPSWGQFRFYEDRHDREGGYFLGTTLNDYIAKGGVEQGELILAKVAAHSSTAYHLSKKLCQKFLGENVSETFINSAAAVFKSSKGDIRTVLRFILKQSNFEANYQPKYKRPFHFTISAMRATNASIPDTGDVLYNILQAMRQQPFQWAPPNGYPDAYAAWVDNLSPRWRVANGVAMNSFWGVRTTDMFRYMVSRTPTGVVAYINRYLFAGRLNAARQTQLKAYMRATNPTNAEIRETVGLALASPEFMWH